MMRFDVFNRERVEKYSTPEKHIVISISDIKSKRPNLPESDSRLDVLFVQFSDFDRIYPTMPKDLKESLFNKRLAQAIWRFVDKYKDEVDLIIVNCEAGISRSSAVAAGIGKVINDDDAAFFKHFLPNMLVYRKMLEAKLQ